MKLRWKQGTALLAGICAAIWMSSCGGSSANVVTVTVSPATATVVAGQVLSFTATVGGSTTTTVQWSCSYAYTPAPTTQVPNPTAVKGTCTSGSSLNGGTVGTWTSSSSSGTNVLTYTAPSLSKFPNPVPQLTFTATADANHGKTGTATVGLDSGIRVSVTPASVTVPVGVTPAQTVQFSASLQNSTPTNLQWLVTQPNRSSSTAANQTANPLGADCSATCGKIDANGVYTAPSTLPTDTTPSKSTSTPATTVYVVVNSKSDPTQFAVATITLISASTNPVTFTGISPTTVAAGGIVQDIFLNAKNLLNTTTITFTPPNSTTPQTIASSATFTIPISTEYCTPSAANVTPVVTCDASIITRIRLNQQQLATPGTGTITVNNIPDPNNPGSTTSISYPLQLTNARPGLVAAVPDSVPQGTNTSFSTDGGYYGGGSSPVVKLLFNGALNTATTFGPRQFTGPLQASQIPSPGLYPVSIVSNAQSNPPPFPTVTTDIAIQPTFSSLVGVGAAIGLPAAGTITNVAPSSIALNSTKGYALITEQGANTVQLLNLSSTGPTLVSGPVAVGNQPTSVAIDDQLTPANSANADLGVVVNSGDSTLSLLAVSPTAVNVVGSPISLKGLFVAAPGTTTTAAPYAVGVDPSTHLAVVAFSNSNIGFIVDVNPNPHPQTQACFSQPSLPNLPTVPPCVVASVSLNTGPNPQVIMQPNVPLAYVTPGGGGVLSVVNLLQTNTSVNIAAANAAPAGAVRTNNVVTIVTTAPHGINPAIGGTVLIAGVTPVDLNGTYQVIPGSVTDPYTFQYTQVGTLANESGGGGTVTYGSPYYTFNVTNTVSGAAINPVTRTIALADPNATIAQISFIRTLDQSVTSLTLTAGSCNGCTPSPSGAPERSFNSVAFDPYTNVVIAYAPTENADPNLDGNKISLINPGGPTSGGGTQSPYRIVAALPTNQVGTGSYTPPGATAPVVVQGPMAYDPKTRFVIVANAGSNSISYLNLDPSNNFKPVAIKRVDVTTAGVPSAQPALGNPTPAGCNPANYGGPFMAQAVMIGCPSATLRIFGQGFATAPGAQVRLEGSTNGVTTTVVNDGEVDATIAGSVFTVPHDYALDVVVSGVNSNTTDLHAVAVTDLTPACNPNDPTVKSGTTLLGQGPEAVALDDIRNVAVVTNYSCSSVSIVNVDEQNLHNYGVPYGAVLSTFKVGAQPIGVAVIPRLGFAVTANNTGSGSSGTGTASIFSIADPKNPASSASDVTVGLAPTGIAIDQDRALALIGNAGSNTISAIDLTVLLSGSVTTHTPTATPVAVGGPPNAIAIDPNRAIAVVTNLQNSGTTSAVGGLDVISLSTNPPSRSTTASISTLTANPTGIAYDPAVSPALFYATSTQANAVYSFNPDNSQTQLIRVGINPFSIAYNYQTGTMLTINSTSNTMSVVDTQTFSTRETLGISSQSQFSAAMDNINNTVAIVDQNNNRVLFVAMPK
jgi:hypothetical protein